MSNPLIKNNAGVMPEQQNANLQAMYEQFKANPLRYLSGLPSEIQTPQQAVEYLANNGRIPAHLKGRVEAMLGRKI